MNQLLGSFKEKAFTKKWFLSYGTLVIGTFILALGYAFFMTPYRIVPGEFTDFNRFTP